MQDWTSCRQDYRGTLIEPGTINKKQSNAVDWCVDTMDLWYGNALVHVWLMTVVPPGTRTYTSRGWCGTRARATSALRVARALNPLVAAMHAGATWSSASGAS